MRVVFVINRLAHGGAETQVIALSKALVSRGHSVMICALRGDNPREGELSGSGVDFVAEQKQFRFDPLLVTRLRGRIHAYRADVIHGVLLEGNLYALLAGMGMGIPVIVSERSVGDYVPLKYRLAIALSRPLATALVANTRAGASYAQRLYGLPERRVHVVQNACELSMDTVSTITGSDFGFPSAKILVVVGRIAPEKDHPLSLETFDRLLALDSSWRLLIVGGAAEGAGDYLSALQSDVQERNLHTHVKFVGFRADSVSIIKGANVLLLTSLREGSPNVVLESMASGTPVISTAFSDIRDMLPFPWQVVEDRDPQRLALAILRADRERADVATKQRIWVSHHAATDAVTTNLEAVYQQYLPQS